MDCLRVINATGGIDCNLNHEKQFESRRMSHTATVVTLRALPHPLA